MRTYYTPQKSTLFLSRRKMSLWKYRHIFGKEKEGAHSLRVFNIAIVDVVLTLLGAWVISKAFHVPFLPTVLGTFLAGILFHRLFCVNTTINQAIFGTV